MSPASQEPESNVTKGKPIEESLEKPTLLCVHHLSTYPVKKAADIEEVGEEAKWTLTRQGA